MGAGNVDTDLQQATAVIIGAGNHYGRIILEECEAKPPDGSDVVVSGLTESIVELVRCDVPTVKVCADPPSRERRGNRDGASSSRGRKMRFGLR